MRPVVWDPAPNLWVLKQIPVWQYQNWIELSDTYLVSAENGRTVWCGHPFMFSVKSLCVWEKQEEQFCRQLTAQQQGLGLIWTEVTTATGGWIVPCLICYSKDPNQNSLIWNIVNEALSERARKEPGVVAHACNPSYLGGREQEDHSLKLAHANSS
jgi:hypothetical protein